VNATAFLCLDQAVGVGSAPIIGRVHIAQLKIGGTFFNCSFTVLDQPDMEFLFGLDMLKRHRVRDAVHASFNLIAN
jgi:DNA damage-inducible protein 1